jgi:hypothetical protein
MSANLGDRRVNVIEYYLSDAAGLWPWTMDLIRR